MKWRKLGNIFCPDNHFPWMKSHAANPTAERIDEDLLRIYFGCRDANNRSHIGSVDVEFRSSFRVRNISTTPHVIPGSLGGFDDSGISMAWLVTVRDSTFLYYIGWNLGVTVPWRNSIGLAVREGVNSSFVKYSSAPVLDRCEVDPFCLSYPCVHSDGIRWKMWYGSHLRCGSSKSDIEHVIKYAESEDGIHWRREGDICIELATEREYSVARPSVTRDRNGYCMWFCYRRESSYGIGFARSSDGIRWTRMDDQVGIDVSKSGWDSEMIEYPFVFDQDDRRFMLYNGNGYGRTGFGLAVLEQD